ncbi:MAG: hypothetical protein KC486_25525, partial [Myxococcales bacterium]|nr:hypothetical protein [Myxococcales bacterium]
MDIKTISTALAVLGTGLNLSACKSSQADATEVPASEHGAEKSCGGEKGCGGEKSCGGEKGCG